MQTAAGRGIPLSRVMAGNERRRPISASMSSGWVRTTENVTFQYFRFHLEPKDRKTFPYDEGTEILSLGNQPYVQGKKG